jgi:Zn-dependent M16 (insulinase) family peptidase
VLLSWLCGDVTDTVETLALSTLSEILLGHDGSPLTRALVDSELGEDLSPVSGFERELRETSFCAGLRGVQPLEETTKKVEALITDELERLESEGIPKEEIEAALLGMEFSNREIRRSGGPFSLVWMSRSLRAWLHGGSPWDSLLFVSPFSELKQRIEEDDRFFEKMIRRYFLDNPHRAFIIIEPEESFLEEKEAALAARLEKIEKSLGSAEKEAIISKTAKLREAQEKEDEPEALAAIPHLSRSDLSPEIETVKREYADVSGAPALFHPIFTNGISYVDLAFPLDLFPPEDYLWFPFFSRAVVSMGLPEMDYGEVSSLLARTAGGFHAMLHSSPQTPGADREEKLPTGNLDLRGRDWIIFRLKALDEKAGASLELALRLITEADFSDLRRIRDLVLEMKNDLDSSLAASAASASSKKLSSGSMIIKARCGLSRK